MDLFLSLGVAVLSIKDDRSTLTKYQHVTDHQCTEKVKSHYNQPGTSPQAVNFLPRLHISKPGSLYMVHVVCFEPGGPFVV